MKKHAKLQWWEKVDDCDTIGGDLVGCEAVEPVSGEAQGKTSSASLKEKAPLITAPAVQCRSDAMKS